MPTAQDVGQQFLKAYYSHLDSDARVKMHTLYVRPFLLWSSARGGGPDRWRRSRDSLERNVTYTDR